MDQSPCYVGAALVAVLNDGQCRTLNCIYSSVELMAICPAFTIPSIAVPGTGFNPLSSSQGNDSYFCNTVWYSLVSACAGCQNGTWPTYVQFVSPGQDRELDSLTRWPDFSQNCNRTYLMA